jgi:hypothetical protein
VVFEPWDGVTWVFSAGSLSGQGTLRRFFPEAPASAGAELRATASYRPEEGRVDFETTEATPFLRRIYASARLPKGQHAARAEVEETEKAGKVSTHRSALFLDETGDFWANLEWMRRCTSEALGTLD